MDAAGGFDDSPPSSALAPRLRAELARRGVASALELGAALGCSQPTVSRLLASLSPSPLAIGRARRARYGWPQAIHGAAAQQTLYWVHEDGRVQPWGTLTFLAGARVHVALASAATSASSASAAPLALLSPPTGALPAAPVATEWLLAGRLPWFLAPLCAEGFLGRLLARRLVALGLADNPERWPLEHQLFAALQTPDSPGAMTLGEPRRGDDAPSELQAGAAASDYDTLADTVAKTLPVGSSAGGEQAKFLTRRRGDGASVLVKFSPPRKTPFGERWHALLHLEALALQVLGERGVAVAETRIVETARRTYLESCRFDRLVIDRQRGLEGRRHVVPLSAVHEAFVQGPRQHWAATAQALVQQRRLDAQAAPQVQALLHFGHLIGNTDMHFGNLSLMVAPQDVAAGRLQLAPLYDMLPMRWRPDPTSGELGLLPFTPEPLDLQSAAREPALQFWERAARLAAIGPEMRALATTMAQRLR